MSNSPKRSRMDKSVFAATLIVLCYPLLGSLWHHDYPLMSAEVGLVALLLAAVACLFGFAASASRPAIVNMTLIAVVVFGLMIQLNLLFEGIVVALVIATLFAWLLGKSFAKALLVIFPTLIVGAYFDHYLDQKRSEQVRSDGEIDASLAPIIHIVLDGMIGVDGLPPQQPAQLFRGELLDFLGKWGFSVDTKAYSPYVATELSLNHAMNFYQETGHHAVSDSLHEQMRVKNNAYLKGLNDAGYRIRIYQSETLEFCGALEGAIERCYVYSVPAVRLAREAIPQLTVRTEVLLKVVARRSNLMTKLFANMRWQLDWGIGLFEPRAIAAVLADVAETGGDGRVFFVHLMLPHAPYVYRPDCQLDYSRHIFWRSPITIDTVDANTYETRGTRYLNYLDQSRCALKQIDQMFQSFQSLGVFDRSIVVLHGDHGSRIVRNSPSYANVQALTSADLLDSYSTLYATRFPGMPASSSDTPIALGDALFKTLNKIGKGHETEPLEPFGPAVYMYGAWPNSPLLLHPFSSETEVEQAKKEFQQSLQDAYRQRQ